MQSALAERTRIWLSAISADQPIELRAQAADTMARSLAEAEPELEKLVRSGYRTVVTFPRRGEGERAAYNLARLKASWLGEGVDAGLTPQEPVAALRGGVAARGLRRAVAEARGVPRAPPAAPPSRGARRRRSRGRGRAQRPAARRAALVHGAARGRRRRARGPWRGALRGLRDAHGGGRHARLPVPGIPGRRPRVRADRPAREDLALRRRRRREPAAVEARRHALGDDEGARAARRAGALGRAAHALRRAAAAHGPRVRRGLRLAARVRAGLRLHRDARPARRDRAGQGRHGGAAADGPADLRRRRLRQDRGRAARRVQGGAGRQAGADARADDDPRAAALRHLRRAPGRLPDHDRARLALPHGGRAERGDQGLCRGSRGHPDRHAPRALARRAREGPRPADRRRGAALRRQAEGAPAPAEAARRRDRDVGDADPAHAADVAGRAARHLGDRDAAGGPPAGEDLRRRVRGGARQARDRARARARRAGLLPAQPRRVDRGDGRAPARALPGRALRRRPRADGRGRARER